MLKMLTCLEHLANASYGGETLTQTTHPHMLPVSSSIVVFREWQICSCECINYTLVKKQSRLDVRKFSFSQRTINIWNNLSTDCVHASSVNMFKNKIDKYLVKAGNT